MIQKLFYSPMKSPPQLHTIPSTFENEIIQLKSIYFLVKESLISRDICVCLHIGRMDVLDVFSFINLLHYILKFGFRNCYWY